MSIVYHRRLTNDERGLNKTGKETTRRRPTGFVRKLSNIDEDEDGDDEFEEYCPLSLPFIQENKERPDTASMSTVLTENKNKSIGKTPPITLPPISQSSTRSSVESFPETSDKVYQRDERDGDLNFQKTEKQEKER